MAREVVGSITSAVTNAVAEKAVSKLVDNLNKQAAADEKLQRLELLLIKIHSAVEASEKHAVENTWLLQWRDKLKEATSAGDEVLASFRQRATDAQATGNANQLQDGASSSSSTAGDTGALSFTRNALSTMVQSLRSASKMIFSSDEDMERLSSAVKNLEQLSPDIGEFIRLLQLEVSPKAEQRPTAEKMEKTNSKENFKRVTIPEIEQGLPKRTRPSSRMGYCAKKYRGFVTLEKEPQLSIMYKEPSEMKTWKSVPVGTQEEPRREVLVHKLRRAHDAICKTVEQADGCDLKDRQWLASWADILREAKKQGCAVLDAITAGPAVVNGKAGEESSTAEFDQENSELRRCVSIMYILAGDVKYFGDLICLCPSY